MLRVVDATLLENLFSGMSSVTSSATISAIQALGTQYQLNVDWGEAFTHAAAVTLDVPSLSHDITALRALVNGAQQSQTLCFVGLTLSLSVFKSGR